MCFCDGTGLRKQERITGAKVRWALEEARNRNIVSRWEREVLKAPNGRYLYATNAYGRIIWGKAFCQALADHFDLDETKTYPDVPLFLVTMTDRSCVTAHDANAVNIPALGRKLRHGLSGLSYYGMIEPAFYINVAKEADILRSKKLVSWHFHGLAWGASASEMKDRFDDLSTGIGCYQPIFAGLKAVHQRRIPRTQMQDKVRYILKAPRKSYRVRKVEFVNGDGEVINGFRQYTSKMRDGERVTLVHLMRDLYLDHLAMAGGQGTAILHKAKRYALRGLSHR